MAGLINIYEFNKKIRKYCHICDIRNHFSYRGGTLYRHEKGENFLWPSPTTVAGIEVKQMLLLTLVLLCQ